jgi:uncharacterized protein DUF6879
MAKVPPFGELIAATTASAVQLEMCDWYAVAEEREAFARWRADPWARTTEADRESRHEWLDLVWTATTRGVVMRRARIVSEPVSEYIRFEWAGTPLNIEAGEQVRWLPRRRASDLCLPGNDFWVFDDRLVQFHYFSGDGDIVEDEHVTEPGVVKLCLSAFEAVWARAIPHAEYRLA